MPDPSNSAPKLLREERLRIHDPATERSEEWLIGQYTVGLAVYLDDDGNPVVHVDGDLPGLRINVNGNEVFPLAELKRFLQ